MKSLETIAEDLFNKIRGRFPSVTIGNEEGKVTNDPKEARFFDFDYKVGSKNIGKVSVSVTEDAVSIMYTNSFMEDQDEQTKQDWYKFLKEIRQFAKKRLLKFDTRDITKSNLDRRDYQFLAKNKFGDTQMSESKLFGTSRVSYQNIGNARLNIRHRKGVNEEDPASRTRSIDKIYIESPEGERFKYPYRHLAGARAMARHVSEGGNPYDDFGKHIVGLSEETGKLRKFKNYVGRSRVMAEGLSQYMDVIEGRLKAVKKEIADIKKSNRYSEIAETFEKVELEEVPENVKANWIDELTIRQFNEELQDIFPYVYRLISEKSADEINPDNFDEEIVSEGERPPYYVDTSGSAPQIKVDATNTVEIKASNRWDEITPEIEEKARMQGFRKEMVVADGKEYPVLMSGKKAFASKNTVEAMMSANESTDEQSQEQLPITEFILSHYDKETGSWPRGETAVLTGVEKDYGDQYIKTAKQFIERINQTFKQYTGVEEACDCEDDTNDERDTDEDFERLKNLAGV
jgi:hypothetical protein